MKVVMAGIVETKYLPELQHLEVLQEEAAVDFLLDLGVHCYCLPVHQIKNQRISFGLVYKQSKFCKYL